MRMVATDLDGTIVGADGLISARTVEVLQACQDAGVLVVYVTGRPPRWVREISDQTGHRGTALCVNGAIVYDLGAEQVLRARTMTSDVVQVVATRLLQAMPDATFAVESLAGFRRTPTFIERWPMPDGSRVGALPDLLDDEPGVVKLLCRSESSRSDDMLALAMPALDGVAVPTHSNVRDCLVEVSPLGVNKASALAEFAASHGVDRSDVVAFGDMPNDLDMLVWAGRGYAMTGGHPDALAAAAHHAPSLRDDGVAQVLEGLLAG